MFPRSQKCVQYLLWADPSCSGIGRPTQANMADHFVHSGTEWSSHQVTPIGAPAGRQSATDHGQRHRRRRHGQRVDRAGEGRRDGDLQPRGAEPGNDGRDGGVARQLQQRFAHDAVPGATAIAPPPSAIAGPSGIMNRFSTAVHVASVTAARAAPTTCTTIGWSIWPLFELDLPRPQSAVASRVTTTTTRPHASPPSATTSPGPAGDSAPGRGFQLVAADDLVVHQLEPHRVEHREGRGQRQAQDPGEVPHGRMSFRVSSSALEVQYAWLFSSRIASGSTLPRSTAYTQLV